MTPAARVVAVVAGIISVLLCGAALVRQAALAADTAVTWRGSAWWSDLTQRSSTATVVAAVVVSAVAVALLVLAYRQVAASQGPEAIEFRVEDGTARLSVPALRKALRRRFESMLPGSVVNQVGIGRRDDGWTARVEAQVPPCDLRDVHDAVLRTFRDDMRKVAGIEIVSLDLVVVSMGASARKRR